MISAKIPFGFLEKRVSIGWPEIEYGLQNQFIAPEAAIEFAVARVVASENPADAEVELAGMSKSERVGDLVARLAKTEKITPVEAINAKWLFIVLSWLFENRLSTPDVLGVLEEIYCAFGHPPEMSSFVRYMPMKGPDLGSISRNEDRMIENWELYLRKAGDKFSKMRPPA